MAAVLPEKKVSLWAARSRQRCVGVQETENEDDQQQQQQQLGPGMGMGMGPGMGPAPVATPVVPERAQAEALSTVRLEKLIGTNSRYCISFLSRWFCAVCLASMCRKSCVGLNFRASRGRTVLNPGPRPSAKPQVLAKGVLLRGVGLCCVHRIDHLSLRHASVVIFLFQAAK